MTSTDGRCAIVYERLGTKALVLVDWRLRREIDRSYYCAEAYDYPITLFHRGGRLLIAHGSEWFDVDGATNDGGELDDGHMVPGVGPARMRVGSAACRAALK